jgi:hypothetical protein
MGVCPSGRTNPPAPLTCAMRRTPKPAWRAMRPRPTPPRLLPPIMRASCQAEPRPVLVVVADGGARAPPLVLVLVALARCRWLPPQCLESPGPDLPYVAKRMFEVFRMFQRYVSYGCCNGSFQMLHMLQWLYTYVARVCSKCFICCRRMLQVFI